MTFVPVGQRPLAFIDTETSGLNPHLHEILEIAVVFEIDEARRLNLPHLTFDEDLGVAYYTTRIKPVNIEVAEPIALKVNGYTPEDWKDAPTFVEVAPILQTLLKDTVPVAHNASFDVDFIQDAFKRTGSDFRMDYHKIDTVTSAFLTMTPDGLQKLSLDTIRTFLGWPKEGGHRALQDALDVRKLFWYTASKLQTGALGDVATERVKQRSRFSDQGDKDLLGAVQHILTSLGDMSSETHAPEWMEYITKKHAGNKRKLLTIASALLVAEIERP